MDSLYIVHTITHYGGEVSRTPGSVPALAPALKAARADPVKSLRYE